MAGQRTTLQRFAFGSHYIATMLLLFSILGSFLVMALTFLLVTVYLRRKAGPQPSYSILLIMATCMGCFLGAFYVLQRFGVDLLHGRPRDLFWLALSIVWLSTAVRIAHQRRSSGTVLMDLGPAPLSKLQMFTAVLLLALATGFALHARSRAQAFGYATWSAWSFVMGRGRFELRDRGLMAGGLLPWNRITGCEGIGGNIVRMHLYMRFREAVDIKVPMDRRERFIQIVNEHLETPNQ